MKLKTGDKIDRYVVDGVIGAGGTAMVYRVHHEKLGTVHALKILGLASEAIRDRLVVEGQAQATMNHPNIVSVTDILDLDGAPGLLMEFIDGPSLEDALVEYDFSLEDLEALFLGVLDGVEVAHGQGIVHRDLKLANILLAPTQQGFVPKVTDFGLAKVLYNKMGVGATQTGVAMGTPGFMAPEQVRDAGQVDERADMFSLGCILYEMVSKQRTFPGDEILQIYINVTKVNFIPIREHLPELPDRFETAINGLLQKNRSDRIPDCATLRAVLREEIGWDKGPVPFVSPIVEEPRASVPPAPSPTGGAADRVVPLLLVGGSIAVLFFVMFFAFLTVGIPLLMMGPADSPEVVAVPSLPVQKPAPEKGIAEAKALAKPEVEPVPVPELEPEPVEFESPTKPRRRPRPVKEPLLPKKLQPSPRSAPVMPAQEFESPHTAPVLPPLQVAAPVMATSSVKIYSRPPSGTLLIDGISTGHRTPNKVTLIPGPHRIGVQLRGFPNLTIDLLAGPNQPARWCADFLSQRTFQGPCPR